ncbi:hypothetical protein AMS68_002348 [Peltaster fructicola]|uniref:Uncharacterized protein n=1 Tax=Peltaster fructicola TaxID=286661 RepID=A0A6H0XQA4_9PEZI|nr:hypothetical protein AMS68_002348 [Peltaster fructicola]
MSGQHTNAWQTARPRQSQSTSRSGNGSPQPSLLAQPSRQGGSTPANNVWTQRGNQNTERARAASPAPGNAADQQHTSANGFNSVEVKAFLSRAAQGSPASYKPAEATNARAGGAAWAAKTNHTANGQPFFAALAKQVAGLENGG